MANPTPSTHTTPEEAAAIMGSNFHGVDAVIAQLDISARVQSVLQDEVTPSLSVQRWWRPVASVAVAASMAAVVVIGMRGLSGGDPMAAPAGGAEVAASGIDATSTAAPAFANAGKVFAPVPHSSTVSATYGGVPTNMVPGPMYGNSQSRAEAEAQIRRRLQQYLLMQAEQSPATAAARNP